MADHILQTTKNIINVLVHTITIFMYIDFNPKGLISDNHDIFT